MYYSVLFDTLTFGSKKKIDMGIIGKSAGMLASLIRSVFLYSNGLRTENVLLFLIRKLISIDRSDEVGPLLLVLMGDSLRYLGPHDREILLLVKKTENVIFGPAGFGKKTARYITLHKLFLERSWVMSTPGIYVKMAGDESEINVLSEIPLPNGLKLGMLFNHAIVFNGKTRKLPAESGKDSGFKSIRNLCNYLLLNDVLVIIIPGENVPFNRESNIHFYYPDPCGTFIKYFGITSVPELLEFIRETGVLPQH